MLELLRQSYTVSSRPLFHWLVPVFNSVSQTRIKEIGPDLACAEWLLRNGASVKWKNSTTFFNDYNSLSTDGDSKNKTFIHEVDATDSGISHEGFSHFENCKFIEEMKLINCIYIGNQALEKLHYLKNSLKNLEISNCGNVTEKGLDSLKNLSNLKTLKISKLYAIKNSKNTEDNLKNILPNCQIILE